MTWLLQVGAYAAAIAAVISLGGLVARSRLGKWLAQSITEDLREHRRAEIDAALEPVMAALGPIKHEVLPNNGSSMADRVARIEQRSNDTHDLLLTHIGDKDAHRRDRRHDD